MWLCEIEFPAQGEDALCRPQLRCSSTHGLLLSPQCCHPPPHLGHTAALLVCAPVHPLHGKVAARLVLHRHLMYTVCSTRRAQDCGVRQVPLKVCPLVEAPPTCPCCHPQSRVQTVFWAGDATPSGTACLLLSPASAAGTTVLLAVPAGPHGQPACLHLAPAFFCLRGSCVVCSATVVCVCLL